MKKNYTVEERRIIYLRMLVEAGKDAAPFYLCIWLRRALEHFHGLPTMDAVKIVDAVKIETFPELWVQRPETYQERYHTSMWFPEEAYTIRTDIVYKAIANCDEQITLLLREPSEGDGHEG